MKRVIIVSLMLCLMYFSTVGFLWDYASSFKGSHLIGGLLIISALLIPSIITVAFALFLYYQGKKMPVK